MPIHPDNGRYQNILMYSDVFNCILWNSTIYGKWLNASEYSRIHQNTLVSAIIRLDGHFSVTLIFIFEKCLILNLMNNSPIIRILIRYRQKKFIIHTCLCTHETSEKIVAVREINLLRIHWHNLDNQLLNQWMRIQYPLGYQCKEH